jgi:hypothetical protein
MAVQRFGYFGLEERISSAKAGRQRRDSSALCAKLSTVLIFNGFSVGPYLCLSGIKSGHIGDAIHQGPSGKE